MERNTSTASTEQILSLASLEASDRICDVAKRSFAARSGSEAYRKAVCRATRRVTRSGSDARCVAKLHTERCDAERCDATYSRISGAGSLGGGGGGWARGSRACDILSQDIMSH